jgi:DHA2 family multidrug resistance protein-like MFS transporter
MSAAVASLTGGRRQAAIATVLLAMAAAVLDASSINIALPSIAAAIDVGPSSAAWLVIAYQGALVASLLPLAAIGERFGYRRTFVAGTVLFGLSALAAALVPAFALLLAFRALQGLGAAAIMALGVVLLRQTVAETEIDHAIGWNAMTVALMSAAGPAIGAALLGFGSWRFVFGGSVLLASASLVLCAALPSPEGARRRLDTRAMALYGAVVPAFVVAAGIVRIWPSFAILLLASGLAGIVYLVRRDRGRLSPFLPLDLLASPDFNRSVRASIACFTGISLALLTLPFALHARLGASVPATALMMTAWPLAVLATTPVTTRLLKRFRAASLCAAGGVTLSCGLLVLALSSPAASPAPHILGIALCGIGFGLFQTPNNRSLFLAVPIDRTASAGGVQGTARLGGQAVGALVASFLLSAEPVRSAGSTAFVIAALATLAAAWISARRLWA